VVEVEVIETVDDESHDQEKEEEDQTVKSVAMKRVLALGSPPVDKGNPIFLWYISG
jgi:hypothetical protein